MRAPCIAAALRRADRNRCRSRYADGRAGREDLWRAPAGIAARPLHPARGARDFLETFEGPLDLLLYLIRRQNINVLDIPMAELTRQYLGYVEMMRRTQLELAAEYLLMAAVLIEIKSRLLSQTARAPGEEERDPRAELVRRLLEYEQMKGAARALDELPLADRDFATVRVWLERVAATRLPGVAPEDLRTAWAVLIARAKGNRHHLVSREQLSVRGEMSRVLKVLSRRVTSSSRIIRGACRCSAPHRHFSRAARARA